MNWVTQWFTDEWIESDTDLQMNGLTEVLIYSWTDSVKFWLTAEWIEPLICSQVEWASHRSLAEWTGNGNDLQLGEMRQILIYSWPVWARHRSTDQCHGQPELTPPAGRHEHRIVLHSIVSTVMDPLISGPSNITPMPHLSALAHWILPPIWARARSRARPRRLQNSSVICN